MLEFLISKIQVHDKVKTDIKESMLDFTSNELPIHWVFDILSLIKSPTIWPICLSWHNTKE